MQYVAFWVNLNNICMIFKVIFATENLRPFWANLYYTGRCSSVCLFVCQHFNVQLTSTPVLKLLLPYDLTEVIKLIEETFGPNFFFFSKKYFMSFHPHYCHSFRITVILSILLSFLPYYCHSFQTTVIPPGFLSFLPYYCHSFCISVIPSELLSFLPNNIAISNIFHPE